MRDFMWIAFGLSWLALAVYLGLVRIATAIRFMNVNVTIAEVRIKHVDD